MTATDLLLEQARQQGQAQAAICAENTRQDDAEWPEKAYVALRSYARLPNHAAGVAWNPEDAVDFALRQPGMTPPHDLRAFGHIFRRMRREGIIFRSAKSFPRRRGHATWTFGWETV
jgi:hypothetical protein